jgi:hypothetical protein
LKTVSDCAALMVLSHGWLDNCLFMLDATKPEVTTEEVSVQGF